MWNQSGRLKAPSCFRWGNTWVLKWIQEAGDRWTYDIAAFMFGLLNDVTITSNKIISRLFRYFYFPRWPPLAKLNFITMWFMIMKKHWELHWTCSFIWTFSIHPSIHSQIWVRIFHYPMHVHIYCLITLCRQPPQVLQCGETWRAQLNQSRRTTVNHVSKSLSQQRQALSHTVWRLHICFVFFVTWLPGWSCKLRILL